MTSVVSFCPKLLVILFVYDLMGAIFYFYRFRFSKQLLLALDNPLVLV